MPELTERQRLLNERNLAEAKRADAQREIKRLTTLLRQAQEDSDRATIMWEIADDKLGALDA